MFINTNEQTQTKMLMTLEYFKVVNNQTFDQYKIWSMDIIINYFKCHLKKIVEYVLAFLKTRLPKRFVGKGKYERSIFVSRVEDV